MKIYLDRILKTKVETIGFPLTEAGKTQQVTIYVHNETEAKVKDLVFSLNEANVKIINPPREMEPNQIVPVVLEWTPPMTFKQSLSAKLEVKGTEIYG